MNRRERGLSLSVWTAVSMPASIIVLGLGVDLAGHTAATQDARAVAGQAARAGSHQTIIDADGSSLDVAAAKHAARQFVEQAGYSAEVTAPGGHSIQVTAHGSYPTTFLGIIGVHSLSIEASSIARGVQVETGMGQG